ncbi:C-myc promoter-binding protein-like [Clytia hemisphaerica]|uniref:Uncharacterized protein n=1 Tax=Clytia hemisphaerica TaxID=252671 RepID=A0A7M5WMT7_9CNID
MAQRLGSDQPRVADYFVTVGLNDLKKPETDADETLEPITDIAVIFKSLGEEPPEGFECIDFTPSGLPANLNHGSLRSPSCFLCFRRGRDKPPLTDIGVLYEGKQRLMHGCDIVHKTPTKQVANVNNANNMRIFITYRRASPQFAHSSLAVIDICIVVASKGEKPPHAFCLVEKGLNQGLVGSDVYLCYRKSLARNNSLSYAAETISRYPIEDYEGYPLPDSVPLFCLPLGAVVECWPEKAQAPLPIFSTFALTSATGEKIYGAGVTFFEEFPTEKYTPEVESLIETQQQTHQDKHLVAQTNKCICLLSQYPFFDAFRRFLMSLYRLTISGTQNIPIERYISHFLHNIPFPTPQKPIVYVQIIHEGFEITEPSNGPIPISGASFTALLRCLGPDNSMVLLYCILTEHKILIHSLRPALLTSVGEALTSLIFPFQWKCPYIPLCPLKLADVLSAPLPFICGFDSRYFDQSSPPSDVTCVDLDTNMITQAVEKNEKPVTWKVLPKKPGKILKDRLDELFAELSKVANEHTNTAVEMAPLDDLTSVKKKKSLEIHIQEAFIRFHAQILKSYKQFLLPITSRPDIGSRDVKTLFDLEGFVRSRPRGTERFFQLMMKTQLFSHFIESRSLSSQNDAELAFFDECTERCEVTSQLLRNTGSSGSSTTVVVTPPDSSGLPPNEVYTYNGFPKLREDLFAAMRPPSLNKTTTNRLLPNVTNTPPRSPIVGRTVHERLQGSMSAKKQANSPTLWARCLLGHCFTLWFIHLPSYIKYFQNKQSLLFKAFEVLKKISETKAKLPDEVCYRVLMQLSGQFNHPALAVKTLFEMKRVGNQPNAVTWGYYHKAVLEGQWLPENASNSPSQLWNRLRLVVMAMNGFRKAITKRNTLVSFDSDEALDKAIGKQTQNHQNPQSAPLGVPGVTPITDSQDDLLVSIETEATPSNIDSQVIGDVTRQQPIAQGFLPGFATDFPDLTSHTTSNPTATASLPSFSINKKLNGHVRNLSLSSQSSDQDGSEALKSMNISKHKRQGSETSVNSSTSGGDTSILRHTESWDDLGGSQSSVADLYSEIGPSSKTSTKRGTIKKRNIALEAIICSCQVCTMCDKVVYDEEIMGAWSADDSNLNIVCPFCKIKRVPMLTISLKDYRGATTSNSSKIVGSVNSLCSDHSKNSANEMFASNSSIPKTIPSEQTQPKANEQTSDTDPFGIFASKDASTPQEETQADALADFFSGGAAPLAADIKPVQQSSTEHQDLVSLESNSAETSVNQNLVSLNQSSSHDIASLSQPGVVSDLVDMQHINQDLVSLTHTPVTSNPVQIQSGSHDLVSLSHSVPNSVASSPASSEKYKRHRKTSSASSGPIYLNTANTFEVEEKVIHSVPYLSPLVLRKELENLLANSEDGGMLLQSKDFVDQKPILYWNLVWYFRRLNLHSHLPSLLLQSMEKNEVGQMSGGSRGEVLISTSWDLNRQTNGFVPLYMLWSNNAERIKENDWTPKSMLTSITSHIQKNDVILPIKMLLDERARQQQKNPEIHWSLYRELLYLALTSCGVNNIEVAAFDREYKNAYREINKEYSDKLFPDDRPPSVKAVFCRIAFGHPMLQSRTPKTTGN